MISFLRSIDIKPDIVLGLVTTIIPVYNRPDMVNRAIHSVLKQTYRPLEVILVNDGSTDATGTVLDELAKTHPDEIRVVHKENGGAGLAREAGRQIARGEFIQYLDSDDWLLPNKFADQVAALRDRPDCDIAYGITTLVDEQGRVLSEPSKRTGDIIETLFPALLLDRWWHTSTPLYSRRISDLAGPWPRQRPEDWDLEARMGAFSPKLAHCSTKVSCHLEHSDDGRVSKGAMDTYIRDEAWFLPRLYDCAIRAGITKDQPEMLHFSRWAFMRARHLGALGDEVLAMKMYALAVEASSVYSIGIHMVGVLASIIGWRRVGVLSQLRERLPL